MLKRFLHSMRPVSGVMFLILGFFGLFLPVLQGILFLLIGLVLLAPYCRIFRWLLAKLGRRYPRLYRRAKRFM